MTNNQLTDAQISTATLIRLIRWADEHKSHYVAAALRELQERRKADSEPVAWVMLEDLADKDIVSTPAYPDINDAMEMTHGELEPLYRHAQQPVTGEPDRQLCKKCNDGLRGGCSACSFSGR
ncbi:hypothetical protein HMPREF9694_05412 [Klebsiella michiganensis]|nr:hypothetical protein HMPREF9694_05412 [Klebsiella michiganensis]